MGQETSNFFAILFFSLLLLVLAPFGLFDFEFDFLGFG